MESKTAVIQKIASDFNLMILADTINSFFLLWPISNSHQAICYEAVAADEPAGKHIALAKKVPANSRSMTCTPEVANYGLEDSDDIESYLTKQAYDQDRSATKI